MSREGAYWLDALWWRLAWRGLITAMIQLGPTKSYDWPTQGKA